ncbi:DUF1761 family protein [candidate division KSB1 bacterium]|nr:DUF1761 family protein [candidate division KSB1 bacterium]
MDAANVNWLAVLVATVSTFVIGGLWYSPLLFGKAWMKAADMTAEKIKQANMVKTYSLAFVFTLVAAINLGFFLAAPEVHAINGALYGFLTGFGWVLPALGVISLFEQKNWTYILINGFYWVVSFTVMGLILGAWK